ncbi:hypothetical protein HY837_04940, partial [archaeon]|nr:hypothetical protein [archaeon]
HLKLGSSPFYYLPEKKEQLENYSDVLNDKEKRAYHLLKQEKILQDSKLDPLTKVCLSQLKDFAEPIKATFSGGSEIFWKWYNINNLEAEEKIKKIINPPKIEEKQAPVPEPIVKKENVKEEKNEFVKEEKKEEAKKLTDFQDEFESYIKDKKIVTLEVISKRSKERDLIVEVPSNIGSLTYFCKIKDKKSITDTDISKAFMQGQARKLPVILLSNGSLNKKAVELMEDLKGVVFSKV